MPSASDTRQPAESARFRVSWLLLVVVGVVVAAIAVLAPSVMLLVEQRGQIADAEQQLAEQRANVEALEEQVARWDDPAYVEAQARDRLFYVFPGETSFVVLDDRSSLETASASVPSATLEEPERDWAKSAAESFLTAGLTDADPADLGIPDAP